MILYAESNFILELAYLQEEHAQCERLLDLARDGSLELILPAFAIAEPYSAWVGRRKRRQAVHGDLARELRELSRSAPYADTAEQFQEITKALLVSGEDEKIRLDETIEAILRACSLIPLEAETIRTAIDLQLTTDLGPQDSMVYASILSDLINVVRVGPKYFVTKNSKDFDNPDITEELARHGCELSTSFGEVYGLVIRPPE